MSRLAAALAYVPQGVICPRCKQRKPARDYSRHGHDCRACRHERYAREKEATMNTKTTYKRGLEKPPSTRCDQCGQTPCQTVQACGRRRTNQEQAERLRRDGKT